MSIIPDALALHCRLFNGPFFPLPLTDWSAGRAPDVRVFIVAQMRAGKWQPFACWVGPSPWSVLELESQQKLLSSARVPPPDGQRSEVLNRCRTAHFYVKMKAAMAADPSIPASVCCRHGLPGLNNAVFPPGRGSALPGVFAAGQ